MLKKILLEISRNTSNNGRTSGILLSMQRIDYVTTPQDSQILDSTAPEAALSLIRGRRTRHEDNIRQDLGRLLDALGIENFITYSTPDGPADLYLPRRRTVVEAKRVGEADEPEKPQARENNESPREQLERYLRSELQRELGFLDLEGQNNRPWIGIVTDGRVWHAWRYAHEPGSIGHEIFHDFRPTTEGDLIARLGQLLSDEPLGKPWIPEQPASIFEPYRERLNEIRSGLTDKREQRTQTKQQLWLDVLRTSSMAPDNQHQVERLFVAHSFLITLARGVVHTLAVPDHNPDATVGPRGSTSTLTSANIRGGRRPFHFPKEHRQKLHSTNPIERLHAEVKRRTNGVGIFPNEAAITRLVGAILLEQNDEWAVSRRYMTLESIAPLSDGVPITLPTVAA